MEVDRDTPNAPRPALMLVADSVLRADALRVAAAADCIVAEGDLPVGNSGSAPSSIRQRWDDASAILLDVDTATAIVRLRLPRRDGVVVLARGSSTVEHWRAATAIGATDVLELPRDEENLVRLLGTRHEFDHGDGGVIAVVGARGGAGASTLAAATALTAATTGIRTLLVDGDAYGAGLDLLLGWEEEPGLRWPGLVVEAGRISGDALHGALPSRGSLSVLSCGRGVPGSSELGVDETASAAVVDAGRRAGDLVVCDVPRWPGPASDVFHDAADLVVLVVSADLGAVAGAENVAGYLSSHNSNVGLVVRGPAPGGLRGSEIADALALPLLATMRPEPGLSRRVEQGGLRIARRSPLGSAARSILGTFAKKPRTRRSAS